MKIPGFVLTDEVMVETYKGQGARGAIYQAAVPVRASVRYRRRQVSAAGGSDVISEATVVADSDDAEKLTVDSRVTIDGRKAVVLERRIPKDLVGPVYVEALVS